MIAPLKMTFYCRDKNKEGIYHAFPVDSTAKHDTAISWAKGDRWSYKAGDYDPNKEPVVFEFENKGFDHVTIVDLYHRGNGGRAYQIIVEVKGKKFKMDLREDTLMDVINLKGIQAGGRLNGTFCFVKESSQTNIILEGTEEHEKAIAEREKRDTFTKTISRKDLKPGYLYKTLTGSYGVFLGFVYASSIDEYDGEVSTPKKQMLFLDSIDSNLLKFLNTGDITYRTEKGKTYTNFSSYYLKVTNSHSYKIEEEKKLDVDIEKIVKHLNELGRVELEEKLGAEKSTSRYLTEFTRPYILQTMRLDKKDVQLDQEVIRAMFKKKDEYYNRRSW